MKIQPHDKYLLCEQINKTKHEEKSFIIYQKEEFPIYKILKISPMIKECQYNIGDMIICNSTGSTVYEDNKTYHLFSIDNIAGKID